MRRGSRQAGINGIIVIVALTFATGLVLGALSNLFQPPVFASNEESRALRVGREFYDSVNALMKTGDDRLLRGMLGEEFHDYSLSGAHAGGADGLVVQLKAKASLQNDLVFVIDEISASENLVFVEIREVATQSPVFAGIVTESESESAGPRNEVLKIEHGLVVDRWVDAPSSPVLATLASSHHVSGIENPVMRWSQLDGRANLVMKINSPSVFVANMGAMRVDVSGSNEGAALIFRGMPTAPGAFEPEVISGITEFGRGDVIIVSAAAIVRIANSTNLLASFLSIGEQGVAEKAIQSRSGSPVTRSGQMAQGFSIDGWAGAAEISIGWAHLARESSFSHGGLQNGAEFVIALDGGVVVEADDGVVRSAASWGDPVESATLSIGTGRGAVIGGAGAVTYAPIPNRTSTFVVVTLVPAGK